jgi:paraquat-inducible protein B
LDLDGLIAEAKQSLARIDALLLDPATQALPTTVEAALTELRGFVTSDDITAIPGDLRLAIANVNDLVAQATAQELVGKITAVLASAERAAGSIETASADLPQITAQLNALTEKAVALNIDQLVTEATATLNSIDTLIGSDQTQDLPRSVSAALDEVRLFLAEVREGGAIDNVNAALASANQAARAIEEAAAGLPALSARATALVRETEQVIEGYGSRSRFNAETLQTLRDIQAAADAVSALARTIQRNPSSLLTGR